MKEHPGRYSIDARLRRTIGHKPQRPRSYTSSITSSIPENAFERFDSKTIKFMRSKLSPFTSLKIVNNSFSAFRKKMQSRYVPVEVLDDLFTPDECKDIVSEVVGPQESVTSLQLVYKALDTFRKKLQGLHITPVEIPEELITQEEREDIIADVVGPQAPVKITKALSALTNQDYYKLMPHGYSGMIVPDSQFGSGFSELFKCWYERTITSVMTSNEAGCRCLIDTWLIEALTLARQKYNKKDLVMTTEYVIPNANLGIEGFEDIGGITDYAFGKLEVRSDAAKYLRAGFSAPPPAIPTLTVIVEAKSETTVNEMCSEAEAVGGLLVLGIHDKSRSHNGLLTDGRSFQFLCATGNSVISSLKLRTDTDKEKERVMGLLIAFIGGLSPTEIPGVSVEPL